MLDRRTTMMTFIECTDFHVATTRYHRVMQTLYAFTKKILNQAYSKSPQQYRLFHQ